MTMNRRQAITAVFRHFLFLLFFIALWFIAAATVAFHFIIGSRVFPTWSIRILTAPTREVLTSDDGQTEPMRN